MQHTVDEVVDLAADSGSLPPRVANGATGHRLAHLVARQVIQPNPRGGFPDPRPPFRTTRTSPQPLRQRRASASTTGAEFTESAASARARSR